MHLIAVRSMMDSYTGAHPEATTVLEGQSKDQASELWIPQRTRAIPY